MCARRVQSSPAGPPACLFLPKCIIAPDPSWPACIPPLIARGTCGRGQKSSGNWICVVVLERWTLADCGAPVCRAETNMRNTQTEPRQRFNGALSSRQDFEAGTDIN